MMYLGDFPVNGKVSFLWNTNGQDGASITRSTDGTLKIFKTHSTAATWATERSSLNGVTQLEDFDQTGIHSVYIDLSDNSDAGFYAAGKEYQVAITGATIDTKTVSNVLAHFSIERDGGALALLKAGIWTANEKTAIRSVLGVEADTATPVAPTVGILSDIDAEVDDIHTVVHSIAVTGSALTKEASSFTKTTGGTETNTYTDTAITNGVLHSIPASSSTIDGYYQFLIGATSAPSKVNVTGLLTEVAPLTETINMYAYRWDSPAWELIHTNVFTGIASNTTTTSHSDNLLSRHVEAGVGTVRIRFAPTGALTNTTTILRIDGINVEYAESVTANVASILADTNELQTDWVNGGRLDLLVDGIKTKTDYLPSATAGSAGGVFIAGTNAATSVTTALTANITGDLSGSVGSVTAGVTVTTNNDKTGYGLASTQTFDMTGNITGNLSGSVGSVTGLTPGNLDVAVSTRLASSGYTAPPTAGDIRTAVGLASANLDTQISALDTLIDTVIADTDEIQTELANGGRVDLLIDGIKAKTDNLPASPAATSDIPSAAAVADAVWNEVLHNDHEEAGSASVLLQGAASAGDPWSTAIPGDYGAGTAGYIVGGNLNATVGSVKAKTDLIPASPASVGDIPSVGAIADAVWDEALSGHSGAGSAGLALSTASSGGVDPSVLADAIWDEALSGHTTGGTAGKKLTDLVNTDLSGVATAADLTTVDGIVDAIKAKTDNLPSDPADQSAVEGAITSAVSTLATSAELAKVPKSDGTATWNNTALASINAEVVDVLRTDTIPDSYSASGAQPTLAQAILAIHQMLTEKSITGTTVTIKKPDGSTTAMTFTLDDGTTPTAITRTT